MKKNAGPSRSAESSACEDSGGDAVLLEKLAGQVPGALYQYRRFPDGRHFFPFASEGIRDIYAVSPEEVVSDASKVLSRLHPNDYEKVISSILHSFKTLKIWECDYRVILPVKGIRRLRGVARPERLSDGSVLWHGYIADATDRELLQEALRRKNEELERYFTLSLDLLCIADTSGHFLRLNPEWENVLGYPVEDLNGRAFLEFVHPDDIEATLQTLSILQSGEDILRFENRYRCSDGSYRWIEWRAKPYEDFIYSVARDVTERKAAEIALEESNKAVRKSESRLQQVLATTPDGFLVANTLGRILKVNSAFCDMLGYSESELMTMSIQDIECKEAPEETREHIRKVMEQGYDRFETIHRRKNGSTVDLEISVSILRGENPALVIFARDITERKRADEALLEINLQLEQATVKANEMAVKAEAANISKSDFLASMSHEIRTPTNGVIGMTGLLLDTELDDEQRRYAESVRSSAESLLSLINDILDFSKIEAGKLDMEELDFDLQNLLEDFADTLAPRAYEKGLELFCVVDPAVPVLLRGDPGRLRQILNNLGGNAIKFTASGEIVVRAETAEHSGSSNGSVLLRFSVRDTGIGIPENKLGLLFRKFSQVDVSTTRQYGGTGLGLSISKRLAEMMGGEIGVASEEGKGSEFWFTARFGLQKASPFRETERPAVLDGLRILVVDDNATSREILSTTLAKWGMRPSEAQDANEALDLLCAADEKRDPFRIALLDMRMPSMDGETLGRFIRREKNFDGLRLALLTSFGARGDAARLREAGFDGYATKPVRHDELRMMLVQLAGGEDALKRSAHRMVTRHTAREAMMTFSGRDGRILLAEDNITSQQVALGILKKFGLFADAVANGKEAVEILASVPYDLVLMDIEMPVMDGLEAVRRIRSLPGSNRNRSVPVVAMTARAMRGEREEFLEAGMNDYITKPVTPSDLAKMLSKWLPERSGNAAVELGGPVNGRRAEGARHAWDRDAFLRRLLGDEALAGSITEDFIRDVERQMGLLREVLDRRDASETERMAHSIKGAAASVDGDAMRDIASRIEKAGKIGDASAAARLFPELQNAFEELRYAMTGQ